MDVPVGQKLAVVAGAFEDGEGSREALARGRVAGREQLAAVRRDREIGVVGPLVDEPDEGQDARPAVPRAGLPVSASPGSSLERLEEPRQAVRAVIEGVIAREEVAGFREEDDDGPHDDADGGPVDVGRVDIRARFFQDLAVRADEKLDGLPHALAQDCREVRLALAAVVDGGEEGRGQARAGWRPELGL